MAGLIMVDRSDGRAVAGLLTSLLANWERIPLSVQATIVKHATETAFESFGRTDGRSVVNAFILKHRIAMAREARWQRRTSGTSHGGLGERAREAVEAIAVRRRTTLGAAARLVNIDLRRLVPKRRHGAVARWWRTLVPRRLMRREPP